MRILVVGGTGFIGSHVVDYFVVKGLDIIVFDPNPERFRLPIPKVKYVRGSLESRNALEAILSNGVDGVLHCASSTLPQSSNDNPVFDIENNLIGSLFLFELCIKYGVKRVVFLSSGGTVYGVPNSIPIAEDHPTHPICSYGVVKLAIENYLFFYHQKSELGYANLRISNPYGARQNPLTGQGAAATFLYQLLHGKPLSLWGDGSVVRDFIDVRDIARLCYLSMLSNENGTFNAGSAVGTSLLDLISFISKQLDVDPVIKRMPARKFDVPVIVLDCRKAEAAFSWKPEIKLEQGLTDLAAWMRREPQLKVTTQGSSECFISKD